MYRYILSVAICVVIWIVNGKEIIRALRERATSEIYIHTGMGIFFSLLTLEWALGVFRLWTRLEILSLRVIGFILFIPSAYLVAVSHYELKHKGRPTSAKISTTTAFVDAGIYRIVRQPMTLGMAIWSIALILVFQSVLSIILGASSIVCFWLSARKEVEYNIGKFGDNYREYMKKIPMWNIIRGLRR